MACWAQQLGLKDHLEAGQEVPGVRAAPVGIQSSAQERGPGADRVVAEVHSPCSLGGRRADIRATGQQLDCHKDDNPQDLQCRASSGREDNRHLQRHAGVKRAYHHGGHGGHSCHRTLQRVSQVWRSE